MKQRDIILVPFPFSDQSGQKVRPALILSNNTFNKTSSDILICAITTVLKQENYTVLLKPTDLEMGILYEPSAIKAETILKLQKNLVIKTIATIKSTTFAKVTTLISELIKETNA